MRELLARFIDGFQKAITGEMKAMQERMGSFEVPIAQGKTLDHQSTETAFFYSFKALTPNEKMVLHTECTLRMNDSEHLVTITGIDKDEVTIRCDHSISLNSNSFVLVIYPWFLYEKLQVILDALRNSKEHYPESALRLFGKLPPVMDINANPVTQFNDLNFSQSQAVSLCCRSNLAFVWGPPGTGKTHTLACIVMELLQQGCRVLVTSTTNAAVDQALAKLAKSDEAQKAIESGLIVRVGQCSAETYGASIKETADRLNAGSREKLKGLRERRFQAESAVRQSVGALKKLEAQSEPEQLQLFSTPSPDKLSVRDLEPVFSRQSVTRIHRYPPVIQIDLIERRRKRWDRVAKLCEEKIRLNAEYLRKSEGAIVRQAQVILATMTNVYISQLMAAERFDAVIVEEAGMAILPTLFYCAALARTKTIMVGDPQQLPPIIQSRDPYVYRAMGRSIFGVTVPNPHQSEVVVMLNEQYRMHPSIGHLVSDLFYNGKLQNGIDEKSRAHIAEKSPFPGEALVVIDTEGRTTCSIHPGNSSRFNEGSAQACVHLAEQAIRDSIESIAIITPYVEQARLIRRLLQSLSPRLQQVECSTVHRFQGNERDLVIFDLVDAAPLSPGILLSGNYFGSSSNHLLNVSISRARGKLIILGDAAYFRSYSSSNYLSSLLEQASAEGRLIRFSSMA